MITISKLVEGEIFVKEDTQYNSVFSSNVTLFENVVARIFGIIEGNITLKKGSRLILHGVHSGKVINEGGELNIYPFNPEHRAIQS